MSDLIQLLRQSLPEAIGGLIGTGVLALLGLLYRRWRRRKREKPTPDRDDAGRPSQIRVGDVSGQVAIGEDITQTQHTVFDQRGQQVGTQYNVAGDYVPQASRYNLQEDRKGAPQLTFTTDIDLSPPTPAEEQAGAKRSWFIRLRIENRGETPATNCYGRLLEVMDDDGRRLKQFDCLDLYWTRQDRPDNYRQLDIRERGDFQYLDIGQVKEAENVLTLRVVVPRGHRLVKPPGHIGRPEDLPPVTYYMRIAIFADNASIEPTWFKIEWKDDFSIDPPCSVRVEKPSHTK